MKTIFLVLILSIIIVGSVIFAISIQSNSYFSKEYYEIKITGLKDEYLVGERYDFSYILYGFGDPCGGIHITFPINKTDSAGTGWIPSCLKIIPTDFVLDMKKTYGTTYGHIALQEAGNYTVKVTFEKGSNGPTVVTKSFLVVDGTSSDEQLRGILYHCKQKELLVDGSIITEDGKIMKLEGSFSEYFNGTHYIDNNVCKWQERK